MADSITLTDRQINKLGSQIGKAISSNIRIGNTHSASSFKESISDRQSNIKKMSEDDYNSLVNRLTDRYNELLRYSYQVDSSRSLEYSKELVEIRNILSNLDENASEIVDLQKQETKDESGNNKISLGKQISTGLKDTLKDTIFSSTEKGEQGLLKIADQLPSTITSAVDSVPALNAIALTVKAINVITNTLSKGFEQSLSLQDQYLGSIDARLNGVTDFLRDDQTSYYKQLQYDMTNAFGGSGFVSIKKLTENIAKLTQSGIAYNLEERALLETVADRLVTTFGTMEGQLDRLIRIQQADLTRSQMGAELSLNEMLNSMFKDTSYLTDVYDSVSSAIIDATANSSYQDVTGINFSIQKWLGSLYSVGMSSGAVTNIAQALNSLATGNIDQLNGTPMGNLFALSARNAGVSYTDILTNGLDASNINELMKSMVEYLQQVSENTSGNVAKTAIYNAIGGGMTYSDIRAMANLSAETISQIYSEGMDYNRAKGVLEENLPKIAERTGTLSRVGNIRDNLLLTLGDSMIGQDNGLINYVLYTLSDMLPGTLGGIAKTGWDIVNVFNGLFNKDSNVIRALWQADLVGNNLLSSIDTFSNFDYSEVTSRGSYLPSSYVEPNTANEYVSYSGYASTQGRGTFGAAGRATGSDVFSGGGRYEAEQESLYKQATSTTLSASNTTGTAAMVRDVGDIYAELFENQTKPIRVSLAKIEGEASDNLRIGPNGILVDIQENDVEKIIGQVYTIRSMY